MISTEQKSSELQEKKLLIHAIRYALYQGHSFSLWKTPTKNEKFLAISTSGVRQINEISLEDSETGFIFSPFLPDAKKIFFPADILYRFEDGRLIEGPASDNFDSTSGTIDSFHLHYLELERNIETPDFKNLVESGIAQIEAGVLEKIVPSRYKDISLNGKFDILTAFDLLCEKHPNALISMVSSPATGTWMGATPELLVSTVQNKFKTVALAGTLPYSPEINLKSVAWTQKEIEEQALVCRYIINCFKKIRLREYEEHGPKTTVAGNLMHQISGHGSFRPMFFIFSQPDFLEAVDYVPANESLFFNFFLCPGDRFEIYFRRVGERSGQCHRLKFVLNCTYQKFRGGSHPGTSRGRGNH